MIPKSIKHEFRLSNTGDGWGRCQAWRFALADVLTVRGLHPDGFRPSPMGPEKNREYKLLRRLAKSTLVRLWSVLDRLAQILEAQGKDY